MLFDDYDLDALELGGVLSWVEPEEDQQVLSYASGPGISLGDSQGLMGNSCDSKVILG